MLRRFACLRTLATVCVFIFAMKGRILNFAVLQGGVKLLLKKYLMHALHPAMWTVLAICVMVPPLQSQAQGRWVKHYEPQGSTYDLSPRPPYGNWPVVYHWSDYGWPLPWTPILSYSSNTDFSAHANGTVTAVWQWLDANGNPAPNPPTKTGSYYAYWRTVHRYSSLNA
jgi:hypothetical protein